MSPEHQLELLPLTKAPAKRFGVALGSLCAGIALVLAGVLFFGPGKLLSIGRADHVSTDEALHRTQVMSALAPIGLPAVEDSQISVAMDIMALPSADRDVLAADLAAKRTRLVWISFYDSDTEDGDVITIQSGGFTQMLRLTASPTTIAIPAPVDGVVRVTGSLDGMGGGVTVGMITPRGPFPLAVLSVGQQISVPVATE